MNSMKIVLDGSPCAGKTSWVKSLKNGHQVAGKTFYGEHEYDADVKGIENRYRTIIYDIYGERLLSKYGNCVELFCDADVIIEFFPIDAPHSFEEAVKIRIPFIKKHCEAPILLVGTKSDLRKVENDQKSCFPSVFGQFVARNAETVKYVECSANTGFNVHKVVEEAIFAVFPRFGLDDMCQDINSMVLDKISPESQWLHALKRLQLKVAFPAIIDSSSFLEDLKIIDRQFVPVKSVYGDSSFKEIYTSRSLDFERIWVSRSYEKAFLTENSQPICAMWFTSDLPEENTVRPLVSQQFHRENIISYLSDFMKTNQASAVNLFFFKQACTAVTNFLSEITKFSIRSLAIVSCQGKLTCSFLSKLEGLKYVVVKDTDVDITALDFSSCSKDTMKHLVLTGCKIKATDVPSVIGKLTNLELLNVTGNNFKRLPITLGSLQKLHELMIDQEKMDFPPPEVLNKSTQDIVHYLDAEPGDLEENKEAKLIVVGQKNVGKTTLIKALQGNKSAKDEPKDNDLAHISILGLEKNVKCNVYDLVGDVECLNTHALFSSPSSLYLVVFDLSQVILSKKARSEDNLCKLELWLESIASHDRNSCVIIVGTHVDARSMCKEVIEINQKLIDELLNKYGPKHIKSFRGDPCKKCKLCNTDEVKEDGNVCSSSENTSTRIIPHILGYFLVGCEKHVGLKELKSEVAASIDYLMEVSESVRIPKNWVAFCDSILNLKEALFISLSRIYDLAEKHEIYIKIEERVMAMLRFYHSQGTFLWYEDQPKMKDIVIIDRQWLPDQLHTLISHRSFACNGILNLSKLQEIWPDMPDKEIYSKLLGLFRSVGLCFSISDTEELFPCNLPVGLPDQEMWPTLPNKEVKQTSLLFEFSFIPPSLFPELIVEIKKSETFALNVKPIFLRFHIVYVKKDQGLSTQLNDQCNQSTAAEHSADVHTVHYELIAYSNSITVSIRGPHPRSIIPDIRSTIKTVQCRQYPGITYDEHLLCPECKMKGVQPPCSFDLEDPHDGVCPRGHIVGRNEDILDGIFSSSAIVPSKVASFRQCVGKTLDDRECPKLFVVFPPDPEKTSKWHLSKKYLLHLLCECPNQWHFVHSPGYTVVKPTEFFEKYGPYICKALKLISSFTALLKTVPTGAVAGSILAVSAQYAAYKLQPLLDIYQRNYPQLYDSSGSSVIDLESSSGLQRSELSRFLTNLDETKGRYFGPLVFTVVESHDACLWLCEEHHKWFVERKVKCH